MEWRDVIRVQGIGSMIGKAESAAVPAGGVAAYFAKAQTFDGLRVDAAVRSRKRAWLIAGLQSVIALASWVAIVCMLPLRTVELRVFRVDASSGVVELVSPLVGPQTYTEAVNKYWARNYVEMREGFLYEQAAANFDRIALMSDSREQTRFRDHYALANPKSPVNVYGRDAVARIEVRSISMLSPNVFLIRFTRTVERQNEKKPSNYMATLTFQFAEAPESVAQQWLNPIGFQVTEYTISAEAL
jgi:type IV secretion system protein VirB8